MACGAADRCGSRRTPPAWNTSWPSAVASASGRCRRPLRRASQRSKSAGVSAMTTKPMRACWMPQYSAHCAEVGARRVACEAQVVRLPGDGVDLARQLRDPEAVDDVVRAQDEVDGRPTGMWISFGGDHARLRVADVPPPALGRDLDLQLARPGPGGRRWVVVTVTTASTARMTTGATIPPAQMKPTRCRGRAAAAAASAGGERAPAPEDGDDDQAGHDHVDGGGEAEHQPPHPGHVAGLGAVVVEDRGRVVAAGGQGDGGDRHRAQRHAPGPAAARASRAPPEDGADGLGEVAPAPRGSRRRRCAGGAGGGARRRGRRRAGRGGGRRSSTGGTGTATRGSRPGRAPPGSRRGCRPWSRRRSPSGAQSSRPGRGVTDPGSTRTSTAWPSAEPGMALGVDGDQALDGDVGGQHRAPVVGHQPQPVPPRRLDRDRPGLGPRERTGKRAATPSPPAARPRLRRITCAG